MALITTLVLCARPQGLVMSFQCVRYMSFSGLLDLRAEESRVVRHVKPPRRGEASRRGIHALSRVRTQAIGALAPGSCPLSYPSAQFIYVVCMCFYGAYNYSGLVRQVYDLVMSVTVRKVHVVLWTAGFKGGGKPCRKTRETAALRRGIQ